MSDTEIELVIVELERQSTPRSGPERITVTRRVAPDAEQAHRLLAESKLFPSAVERVAGLAHSARWEQVAYFSVCDCTGAAPDGIYVFGAAFPGSRTMLESLQNCYVYLNGVAEPFFDASSLPGTPPGYIVCPVDIALAGQYLFWLQAETFVNPYDNNWDSREYRLEVCIDDETVLVRTLAVPGLITIPVVASLRTGLHLFQVVQQGTGGFLVHNVTVWLLPPSIGHPLP